VQQLSLNRVDVVMVGSAPVVHDGIDSSVLHRPVGM